MIICYIVFTGPSQKVFRSTSLLQLGVFSSASGEVQYIHGFFLVAKIIFDIF